MAKSNFFTELKRRQIYRGGVMYVVAGWVVVQVATQVFPFFSIPVWAIRFVVVAILLGFPLLLVWLWMFESSLPTEDDAHLVDRRRGGDRGGDSTEALARIMEVERNERQKENQVLIAALAQLKGAHDQPAESPADTIAALQGRHGHRVVPESGHTPPAVPYTPPPPAKRKSRTMVVVTVVAIFVVLSGLWTLLAPQTALQPAAAAATTGQLAEKYVAPGFAQVEDFGVTLLRPVLAKLGLHIAPERVVTALMVLLALVLVRDFYRKVTRSRSRRAPSH
jgi:hypothetical protein